MQNKVDVEENSSSRMATSGGRARWPGRGLLFACILILVFIILGVGIFLITYFTLRRDETPGRSTSTNAAVGSRPEVSEARTDAGRVRGRLVRTPDGGKVHQYLGIPYAKPPVGNLRLADPVPSGPFPNGVMEAVKFGDTCPQTLAFLSTPPPKLSMSEDCLNLNIWVPYPRRDKRAVMVWIYGGAFVFGSSALAKYNGKTLAGYNDVIVVTLNYRLGVLGFLSTGDGEIKGNYGLKDQVLALKWIRRNIEAFGGDPESVTIFGESAGAMSAGFHLFMPQSARLFRRAILQSGVHIAPGMVVRNKQLRDQSKAIFDALKCPDSESVLECLRQKDADDIVVTQQGVITGDGLVWGPSIDGEFITDEPSKLLTRAKMLEADVMIGVNKDEGTLFLPLYFPSLRTDSESLNTFEKLTQGILVMNMLSTDTVRSKIEEIYKPENTSSGAAVRGALADIMADKLFTCPTTHFANHLRSGGVRNYLYVLGFRASNDPTPPWMGVIHSADIQWVFGVPLNESRGYTKEEQEFSRQIMSYWSNFAKYGSPNQETLPHWPANRGQVSSYIVFDSPTSVSVHRNATYRNETCPFWHQLM